LKNFKRDGEKMTDDERFNTYNFFQSNSDLLEEYNKLKKDNIIIKSLKFENNLFLCHNPSIYINGNKIRQTDCSTRAIATLLDRPWQEIFDMQLELAKKYSVLPHNNEIINTILKSYGYQHEKCELFVREHKRVVNYILKHPKYKFAFYINHHILAYKNYTLYDDWYYNNKCTENDPLHPFNKFITALFASLRRVSYKNDEERDDSWSLDFLKS